MEIKRAGSQASGKGPAEWFTGTVRIDPLFTAPDPGRVAGAGRKTLAWRDTHDRDDSHCDSGEAGRQGSRVAGAGERRAVHRLKHFG